jgi:hypothetical protein
MRIEFEQPELESIRQVRLAELDAEALERRTAQRERDAWERDELRNAVRNTQLPVRSDPPTRGQDTEPPAEPKYPTAGRVLNDEPQPVARTFDGCGDGSEMTKSTTGKRSSEKRRPGHQPELSTHARAH